jgi:hypothetical protein
MTSRSKAEKIARNQSIDDKGIVYLVVKNSNNSEHLVVAELDFDEDESEIVSKFFEGILIK